MLSVGKVVAAMFYAQKGMLPVNLQERGTINAAVYSSTLKCLLTVIRCHNPGLLTKGVWHYYLNDIAHSHMATSGTLVTNLVEEFGSSTI